VVRQREGEVEPPLHPSGVAADLPVGGGPKAHSLEQLVRSSVPGVAPHAVERQLQLQMLAARQQGVEGRLLERRADRPPHGRPVPHDVVAADPRAPTGRGEQRREHVDGRGLSRAVRAEEAVDLTGGDVEVDARDGPDPALELPDEPPDLDRAVHALSLPMYESCKAPDLWVA
jgi:hypothetical protein